MTRILLLSDTHSHWDDRYAKYAAECDEIWHVGDIGTPEVTDKLAALKPLRAVYGNIDGSDLRRQFPEVLRFRCEEAEVVMKHIGGYPGKYDRSIVTELFRNQMAEDYARQFGKALTSGSDCHHRAHACKGGIETSHVIRTPKDLTDVLRSGEYRLYRG